MKIRNIIKKLLFPVVAICIMSCIKIEAEQNTDILVSVIESSDFLFAKPGQMTNVKIMAACNDPITSMKIVTNSQNLKIDPSTFTFSLIETDNPLTVDNSGNFNREVKSFMVSIPVSIPSNALGQKVTFGVLFTSSAEKTAVVDCAISVIDFDFFTSAKTLQFKNTKTSIVFYDANKHNTFTFESMVKVSTNPMEADIFNWIDTSVPEHTKIMLCSPNHSKVKELAASLNIVGFNNLTLGETKMMTSPVVFQKVDDNVLADLDFSTAQDQIEIYNGMSVALKLPDGRKSVIFIRSISSTNTITINAKVQLNATN